MSVRHHIYEQDHSATARRLKTTVIKTAVAGIHIWFRRKNDDPVTLEFGGKVVHPRVPHTRFSAGGGYHVSPVKKPVIRKHAADHCLELRRLDYGPEFGTELKGRIDADDCRGLVLAAAVVIPVVVEHFIVSEGLLDHIAYFQSAVVGGTAGKNREDNNCRQGRTPQQTVWVMSHITTPR